MTSSEKKYIYYKDGMSQKHWQGIFLQVFIKSCVLFLLF